MESIDKADEWSKILRPISDEQGANAAVTMLLRLRNGELDALLVKRVENSTDPWSGQVAFPGGKRDANDLSLKDTAVRETLEETHINLFDSCRFLGVLEAIRSRPRPDLKILPFVVLIEREQPIRLSVEELADFFWIPIRDIISGNGEAEVIVGKVPAYVIGSTTIWGLTYSIIKDFVRTVGLG